MADGAVPRVLPWLPCGPDELRERGPHAAALLALRALDEAPVSLLTVVAADNLR